MLLVLQKAARKSGVDDDSRGNHDVIWTEASQLYIRLNRVGAPEACCELNLVYAVALPTTSSAGDGAERPASAASCITAAGGVSSEQTAVCLNVASIKRETTRLLTLESSA